jgi:iron(III) transport system substrate-binding protein
MQRVHFRIPAVDIDSHSLSAMNSSVLKRIMRFPMNFRAFTLLAGFAAAAFLQAPANAQPAEADQTVVVYSARKEELIKPIFDKFTAETGIKVQFLHDESPKLIARIASEGEATPADMLITVDVANLTIAKDKGIFAPTESALLEKNIPAKYRDTEKQWFGLSKRERAIFYNKDKVKPEELSTYEALVDSKWKGEILTRSSAHAYNQSLLANVIAVHGTKGAQKWAEGLVANFARAPQGGDSDQLRAVGAGEAKLAIANSYYYGRMLTSDLPEDKLVKEKVGIFFPNQKAAKGELDGVHANISGAGITKHSKHKENALKLLEFLSGDHAQRIYADGNKEFPINPAVAPHEVLASWGSFREDSTPLADWAKFSKQATMIADLAKWK